MLGGGLTGLACAYELALRGVAVAVVDGAPPGAAPASSAAAGMLDPLTVKGRLMWQGEAAFSAALRLIRAADGATCEQCGLLHAPHSAKHAEQLMRAADDPALAGCQWLSADEAQAAAPTFRLPRGALLCPQGCVVDAPAYLQALWRLVQATHPNVRWVLRRPRRSTSVRRWASAFDVVVVAAGAGCVAVEETRHLPLELCRGQTLHYAAEAGGERSGAGAEA